MCTLEGGEAAASAIAGDPTVVAVVGTTCSSAAGGAAPVLSNAGYSMVSPSNTASLLTDPATHEAGYLRTAWNDADFAAAMAEFFKDQGAGTSAVIAGEGFPASVVLGESFVETFEALGGNNLAFAVAGDVGGAVQAVIDAGPPDVLYFPVLEPLGSAIVSTARDRTELDGTVLATWDGLFSQEFVDGLGGDAEGMFFGVPDNSFTESSGYASFAAAYREAFGEDPLPFFSAHAFDAATLITNAMLNTAVIDSDGTLYIGRQALRDELFATEGLEGLTGTITCSPLGECGATESVIYTVVQGEFVRVR